MSSSRDSRVEERADEAPASDQVQTLCRTAFDGRATIQATLTAREREVLQLAAGGNSTRKIAELLGLRPSTVKTHFEHVYDKLGTHDRVSAVAECLRGGLIE